MQATVSLAKALKIAVFNLEAYGMVMWIGSIAFSSGR